MRKRIGVNSQRGPQVAYCTMGHPPEPLPATPVATAQSQGRAIVKKGRWIRHGYPGAGGHSRDSSEC